MTFQTVHYGCSRKENRRNLKKIFNRILCVESKHRSLTEWLTGWNCLAFFNKRKLNMAVHSFFQTFFPLAQWYAGSYKAVFKISTISANHFLKVFMLACKSILLKFHLRDWQVSYKHYPNIASSKHEYFPGEPAPDPHQESHALTHWIFLG